MKPLISFVLVLTSCVFFNTIAAQQKTENLIIVTLDGMRWQEVFGGADKALIQNKQFTKNIGAVKEMFWHNQSLERRKKLFPFLWNVVAQQGQLYGNRKYGNFVNIANKYNFSYPGYNEIFTGYPDIMVKSNDTIKNQNQNVLEFINQQPSYQGKVAVFATWEVMPYILNKWRSNLYINAHEDTVYLKNSHLQLINDMQNLTAKPLDVRPDILTYMLAREYLKSYTPKVMYISFDETDDFAHQGMYDQYLRSAHAQDKMLADLWAYLQQHPTYKDKTTLIITADHGRGDIKKQNWVDHGEDIPESNQIWVAVIGPDTPPSGELKTPGMVYQKQLAATFAAMLGFNFTANHPVASPCNSMFVPLQGLVGKK